MQTLNDKGLFKNFMMDKLEESSAQDKLNLMIIRGQDPSQYIEKFNDSPISFKKTGDQLGHRPSPREIRLQYVGQSLDIS